MYIYICTYIYVIYVWYMHIYKLDKQNEFKRRIRFPDNIIIMKLN